MFGRTMLLQAMVGILAAPALAWTPSKEVELVVSAQKNSASDRMCRFVAKTMEKQGAFPAGHIVTNKAGQQGAEGLVYVKNKPGDPHVMVQASANVFFAPIAIGANFKYSEFAPYGLMATDDFILWVNADTSFNSVADLVRAVKSRPGAFQMGGTGVGREDQVVTTLFEQAAGIRFSYVGFKGGADAARALADKRIDATVNNPSEAVDFWKQGRIRPLAVFSPRRFPYAPWKNIPTTKEAGHDIQYKMLRGLLGAPGVSPEVVKYWSAALSRAYQSPEFQAYMREAGLTGEFKSGADLSAYLKEQNSLNMELLSKTDLN